MSTHTRKFPVRKLTVTAMLGAVSTVLMYCSIELPFIIPKFISLDISELPALIASFALGPIYGVIVCILKNALHLGISQTMFIGELSNFILGSVFVFSSGLLYKFIHGRRGALVGSITGAILMAVVSVFSNYYVVYPAFAKVMSMDVILGMYRAINPKVETLWDALLWFNMPFTFIKGMLSVLITFLIYKKISPLLKGKK